MVERWKERKSQTDAGLRFERSGPPVPAPPRPRLCRAFATTLVLNAHLTALHAARNDRLRTPNTTKDRMVWFPRAYARRPRALGCSTQCRRTRMGLMQRSSSGKLWAVLCRTTAALHHTKLTLDGYTGEASLGNPCPAAAGPAAPAVRLWLRSWSQRGGSHFWRSRNTVQPLSVILGQRQPGTHGI